MLLAALIVYLMLTLPELMLASNPRLTEDYVEAHSLSVKSGLCEDSRCLCEYSANEIIKITCRCSPQDQEASLDVHPSSVPRDVSHVIIQSCRSVIFHEGGLKHLNHLFDVSVVDVGEVVFHSGSFNQHNVDHETVVHIRRCRQLTIESGAFTSHPLRPVSVSSAHCHSVKVEELAFSRLSQLNLTNIQSLHLASQAFRFAIGSLTAMDHIHTKIWIEHVTMTKLRSFTFPSPLDELHFENVTILGQIQANATSALRVVHLIIHGCKIGSITAGAFSELTHLDKLEMRSTRVDQIDSKAFASAASSLVFEGCHIGKMNQSALYMPVARVTLRDNHIGVLATGALHLREWNELLVENNTVDLVERHAFYHIGEPKLLPFPPFSREGSVIDQVPSVRFVIRGNTFHRTQLGAFIISAQVPQLKLERNSFRQDCDCRMASWAGRLTQISRQTESTTSGNFEETLPNALWLGSSLFNSSLCWLDRAAAECLEFSEPKFLPMNNYTEQYCSALKESEINHCLTTKRSQQDVYGIVIDFQADSGSGTKLVSFSSRQDLVMIIILGVLCGFVLLAVCIGLVVTQLRSQRQRPHASQKVLSAEERVTCSPLIPDAEKSLGSGVVSSGSISRLSVKEYRHYLEELGPIYSEPMDLPDRSHISDNQVTPPALPVMPLEWTPKSALKTDEGNKRTIDRGTQTFEEPSTKPVTTDDSIASVHVVEPTSSLALEFTEDVMAALRDKMDISPLYSEVKDSIVTEKVDQTAIPQIKDVYDQIKVVDIGQNKPSTFSTSSDNIYCKPWNCDPLNSPKPPSDDKKPQELKLNEKNSQENSPSSKINSLPPLKMRKENIKSQPFHIRGSLPKWPPATKSTVSPNSKSSKSKLTSPPASPTKESKPPLSSRSPGRTIGKTATQTTSCESPKSPSPASIEVKSHAKSQPRKKSLTGKLSSPDTVPSSSSPCPENEHVDDYAQVVDKPFSFSFRRPLFSERQETIHATDATAPPKPARKALLCEYSNPRDLDEPLYSELIGEEEKQPYLL